MSTSRMVWSLEAILLVIWVLVIVELVAYRFRTDLREN